MLASYPLVLIVREFMLHQIIRGPSCGKLTTRLLVNLR
jgi:hypothetical protein